MQRRRNGIIVFVRSHSRDYVSESSVSAVAV